MHTVTRPKWMQIVLTALAVGLFSACMSDEERVASGMEKAQAFVEEGRDQEAIVELRAVLGVDPSNGAAHYELAQAYMRTQNGPAALWSLKETIRLDPDNDEARRSLGGLALAAKDFDEALKQAQAAIDSDYSAGDAYVIKARALEGLSQLEEAETAYRAALDVRPDDSGYAMLLSSFYERTGQREKAEALVRKIVEQDGSYESYIALAFFLRRSEDRNDESVASFQKALELAKQNQKHLVYAALARYYASLDENEKVIETLKEGMEKAHKTDNLRLQLAKFYRAQGMEEEADKLMQNLTEGKRPANPEPHLTLAAYRMDRFDLEGAMAAVEAALDASPGYIRARLRKAEILLEMGSETDPAKVAEARQIVEGVFVEEPQNTDALFVRAKVEAAEGDYQTATSTLRETIVSRPDWAPGHMVLGAMLMELESYQDARAALARAIELDAGLLDARFLIAQVHAILGEHEYAVEQGRVFLRVQHSNVAARLLVAESLAALGKLDAAAEEILAIPESERTPEVSYALGKLALRSSNNEEARKHLSAASEQLPNQAEILQGLLQIDIAEGRIDASLERISAASQAEPENAQLAFLLGRVRLIKADLEGAAESFERAIELEPRSLTAYQFLADVHRSRGQLDEAVATYDRAIAVWPELGRLHERKALLLEKKGDVPKAMASYRAAIELDVTLGLSKNNLAYLIGEQGGNLDEALRLAEEAKKLRPKDAGTADTLGWILFKQGRAAEAVTYLKEAERGWKNEASLGVVQYHLALAYEADGAPEKAAEMADRVVAGLDSQREATGGDGTQVAEPAWAQEARKLAARLDG